MDREKLLEKIDEMNERLKMLKAQGESSKNKTLKNIRARRNRVIKNLVEMLTSETSYYSIVIKE